MSHFWENNTLDADEQKRLYTQILVGAVGVFLNLYIFIRLVPHSGWWINASGGHSTQFFVVSLAFSDLLSDLQLIVVSSMVSYTNSFSRQLCVAQHISMTAAKCVSLCSLTMCAYERYKAIITHEPMSRNQAIKGYLGIWIFSICLPLVALSPLGSISVSDSGVSCHGSYGVIGVNAVYAFACPIIGLGLLFTCFFWHWKIVSGFSLLAGAGSKLQNSRLKSRSEIAQGGSFVRRESVFSSLNNSPIVHDLDAADAEDNEVKTTTLATTTMMASQLTLTTQDSLMMSTVPLHMLSIDLSPIKGEEGGSLEPQAHSSVEADGHEQEAEDGKAAAVVVVGEDEDTVDRWAVVVPHNKTKNTDAQMRDVFTRRMLKQFVRATTLDQRRQKLNKIMKDANKESADKTKPRGSRIQPNFVRKQREFSRRLLCLTIIVFIVWGPFFVLVTYKQLSLKSLPSGLVWTTELLVHMASIINPIFTMFIPKFMQILMQPCRKCATRIRE